MAKDTITVTGSLGMGDIIRKAVNHHPTGLSPAIPGGFLIQSLEIMPLPMAESEADTQYFGTDQGLFLEWTVFESDSPEAAVEPTSFFDKSVALYGALHLPWSRRAEGVSIIKEMPSIRLAYPWITVPTGEPEPVISDFIHVKMAAKGLEATPEPLYVFQYRMVYKPASMSKVEYLQRRAELCHA